LRRDSNTNYFFREKNFTQRACSGLFWVFFKIFLPFLGGLRYGCVLDSFNLFFNFLYMSEDRKITEIFDRAEELMAVDGYEYDEEGKLNEEDAEIVLAAIRKELGFDSLLLQAKFGEEEGKVFEPIHTREYLEMLLSDDTVGIEDKRNQSELAVDKDSDYDFFSSWYFGGLDGDAYCDWALQARDRYIGVRTPEAVAYYLSILPILHNDWVVLRDICRANQASVFTLPVESAARAYRAVKERLEGIVVPAFSGMLQSDLPEGRNIDVGPAVGRLDLCGNFAERVVDVAVQISSSDLTVTNLSIREVVKGRWALADARVEAGKVYVPVDILEQFVSWYLIAEAFKDKDDLEEAAEVSSAEGIDGLDGKLRMHMIEELPADRDLIRALSNFPIQFVEDQEREFDEWAEGSVEGDLSEVARQMKLLKEKRQFILDAIEALDFAWSGDKGFRENEVDEECRQRLIILFKKYEALAVELELNAKLDQLERSADDFEELELLEVTDKGWDGADQKKWLDKWPLNKERWEFEAMVGAWPEHELNKDERDERDEYAEQFERENNAEWLAWYESCDSWAEYGGGLANCEEHWDPTEGSFDSDF